MAILLINRSEFHRLPTAGTGADASESYLSLAEYAE